MMVAINHAYIRHLPSDSSLQGNQNRFRMDMLARALRFRWDKNT